MPDDISESKSKSNRKRNLIIAAAALVIAVVLIIVIPRGGTAQTVAEPFFSQRPYALGQEVARIDLNEVRWDPYNRGTFTQDVHIPAAGDYMLVFNYRPVIDTVQPTEILVTVGEASYLIALEQSYVFDQFPFATDERGDERRPRLIKNMMWMSAPAYRADGGQSAPVIFPMAAGNNTITLESVGGSESLRDVAIVGAVRIPDYAEYRARTNAAEASDVLHITEAQNASALSTRTIQLHSLAEAGLMPETFGTTAFNTIGGVSWRLPGEWIEWTVNVPQSGFYHIAFRYQQNINPAFHSFRRMEVNGAVPFTELLNVPFPFTASWSNLAIGGEEPFMIYLNAGENTIRLTATNEPYFDVYETLLAISEEIRVLDIYIRGITGVHSDRQVDTHRIFQLERYIPDLSDTLAALAASIEAQMDILSAITGTPSVRFDLLRQEVRNLTRFAENLNLLTNSHDALLRTLTSISEFAVSLMESPLLLDTVIVASPDERFPRARANFFQTASFMTRQLVSSFTDDRGTVAARDPDVLQVWVQRGRDYINMMQRHANDYFTPASGIEVAFNFMPGPDLLILANAAGQQPSVVSGIGRDVPFNFSLRNALVPLSQQDGFDALMENIPPGSMVPYHFAGEMYALPEEIIFNVLFYRRDIFDDYNLAPPSTWEDAKRIIPTLQQNHMNFWIAWGDWLTFYYQFEVPAYTPNGLDIALDSEEGFQVFRYWSELYTRFNFPHRIGSFYQSFRRGHIPVGISSLQDYFFMRLAAPELAGLWSIAPVPGIVNEDGVNVRWQSGDQRGVVLFKTDEVREAKGWEFIKWWMDTDTQINFALDLEFSLGQEFRWFSANPEVVAVIPWDENDRRTIMTQMDWFKGIPFAPGGSYLLEREMRNALSDVVIDGRNYRDTLQNGMRTVRQEMTRVQRQFNIIDDDGRILRELSMLDVPLPAIAFEDMEAVHD